ncbi:ATP-binding protein [Pseudopedobacter beijingensis]|uniref:histidine kinase n=1 Tax=Pseudopedobacter beijingensis TaxID=1207056 RepID=A0ABW4IH23_9SPHI
MKKLSSVYRWLLVMILTLILIFLLVSLAKRKNAAAKIEENFVELKKNNSYVSLIDSSIYKLLSIENNLQLYAVTRADVYYENYLLSLNELSALIDSLETHLNLTEQKDGVGLDQLVKQKVDRSKVFLYLRTVNDSLIVFSSRLNENVNLRDIKLRLLPVEINRLESVYVTTNTNFVPVKENKKLFGRLKDAIVNKDLTFDTLKTVDSKKESTSTDNMDEVKENRLKNAERIKQYNAVLKSAISRLVNIHEDLKKKETELFLTNNTLLTKLKDAFQELKTLEDPNVQTTKLHQETKKSLSVIETFYEYVLIISILLVLIIFLNIWSLFKNEKKLKQAKEFAVRQTKIKTDFLAQMSHEIRTPLNSILGFSEQLENSELSTNQKDHLDSVKKASQILLSIVNDILDLSKIETGKLSIQSFPFFPRKTIDDIVATLKIHADNKKLDLIVNCDFEEDVELEGDEYRLKQVIINLVNNAIKFTKKGSVTLNVELTKDCVLKAEVIDTGIGIDKQNFDMVFNEFTQILNKNDLNRHNGTGLGLAICKKIIESQKGFIGVESEVGKGSRFFFEIPYTNCIRKVSPKVVKKSKKLDAIDVSLLAGKRLLVADDNKMNIMLLKVIFDKWSVYFDEAKDGLEALELFKNNDYDVLLTDIQMPNLDGLGLTAEIRAMEDRKKSRIPIIAITANAMESNEFLYQKAGIDDYIVKPFKEETLYYKILKHTV